jgi:mannose-6-phosphate isomerase-like protein (cupin superfamily)
MPIPVFDYRTDLQNLVVRPEGRARFRRVDLGPLPAMHSHDLGGETFLVLEGHIEFHVEAERVTCEPGQLIYVPPRTRHAVRAVGDRPGAIFLSVTPHVEPTHTFYDDHDACLPPRYGVWRDAGGGEPESTASPTERMAELTAAAERLLQLASNNLNTVRQTPPQTVEADAKQAIDALWAALVPLLDEVRNLERAWNALALLALER